MGRYPIGARAMTSAERSERWRDGGGKRGKRRSERDRELGIGRAEARRIIGEPEPGDAVMVVKERTDLERRTARFLELLEAEREGRGIGEVEGKMG